MKEVLKDQAKDQAKELENYIRNKHTQEECIGFIDGFERANELFALYGVSQQRELLIAFSMQRNKAPKEFRPQYEREVDEYLKAINCG